MIPIIFFAVGGSFSFQRTISNDVTAGSSLSGLTTSGRHLGTMGYTVIPGIAYAIVVWLIAINAKRIVPLALQMKMISLLAALTICSALWSQSPSRSALDGGFYFIETLFAFVLVLKYDSEEIQSMILRTGFILAILGLLTALFLPQYGTMRTAHGIAWNGVFGDRTSAGKSLVFLMTPAIIYRRHWFNYRRLLYLALMLLMIFKTDAKTAWILSLFYIALMGVIGISRKFGRRSSLIIMGAFLAVAVLLVCVALLYLPRVLEGLGKDATLTGRTGIWFLLIKSIAKRPLLGYGYDAFWQGLKGESANVIVAVHWVFGYAHNGMLEVCLQLGLVGLAVFFITLFQAIKNAWFCLRNSCSSGVEWYIGLIALTIVYNIDECTVLWPFELLTILYLVACCGLAKAAGQIKQRKMIEAMYS
jgi:exopolysaccharide production protein ExoQ